MMGLKQLIPVKLKQILKEAYLDIRDFDMRVVFARAYCTWSDESIKGRTIKNREILRYLENNFQYVIENYQNKKEPEVSGNTENSPVWIFWWQGVEQMPDVIKMCLQSKIKNAGKHSVIILTKENIKEYLELPKYIWEQFESGKLRIQHLADIIRVCLIRQYGGVWLDASIYCAKTIDESIFKQPLYSIKSIQDEEFISKNRWTTFAIGGLKDNVLCSFLEEFFREYCKTGKRFMDYFMFDCAIALAYEKIPAVKQSIDTLSVSEGDCYWLNEQLDEKLTEELVQEFEKQEMLFYKIGWNRESLKTNIDQESFYMYLLKKEGIYE